MRPIAAGPPQSASAGQAIRAPASARVVVEVDRGGGAVVLAGGVDRARVGENQRSYSADGGLVDRRRVRPTSGARSRAGTTPGRRRSCVSGSAARLDQEEPVVVGGRERPGLSASNSVRVGTMSSTATRSTRSGWSSAMRWATRPPRSWPATPKRAWPRRAISATMSRGHRALGVAGVVRRRRAACRAVAVAAQVGRDHGEPLGQGRGHPVPAGVRLRVAVQQQQRGPGAAGLVGDRRLADVLGALAEALDHGGETTPAWRPPLSRSGCRPAAAPRCRRRPPARSSCPPCAGGP